MLNLLNSIQDQHDEFEALIDAELLRIESVGGVSDADFPGVPECCQGDYAGPVSGSTGWNKIPFSAVAKHGTERQLLYFRSMVTY